MIKKILLFLLAALVVIQFFHPKKNIEEGLSANDITTKYKMPEDIKTIMDKACNDCHSNNTRYPWYNNIQPVAWWLDNHIREGKQHLNFSEYTNKRPRFQYHKMEDIIEQVKKGEMPLDSYTWIHKDAILTQEEKTKIIDWANAVMDQMKTEYPIDSLVRKRS
ncbi:MAG: cytochrome C [Terrimonas sp.]|nr:cytochrome C [Terrimonas sp.]